MIRFQFPQGHPMQRVAYTPDSLAVVTAQPHTGVFVRDRFSGKTIQELGVSNVARFDQLLLSSCGRYLIVRHPKGLEIRPLDNPLLCLTHLRVTAFAIHDRRVIAAFGNNSVIEWALDAANEVRDGIPIRPPVTLATSGTVIAMSPDGQGAVAVRQRGKPQLVELATGQTVAELSFPLRRTATALTGFAIFSPNAEKLALCNGEKLAVFDLAGFDWATVPEKPRPLQPLAELERPDPDEGGTVKDRRTELWLPPLAFTPDGRHFLTLGLRERVQLFDANTATVTEQWGWRMEEVTCLAVAPDGATAVAGGRRGRMTLWDLD